MTALPFIFLHVILNMNGWLGNYFNRMVSVEESSAVKKLPFK